MRIYDKKIRMGDELLLKVMHGEIALMEMESEAYNYAVRNGKNEKFKSVMDRIEKVHEAIECSSALEQYANINRLMFEDMLRKNHILKNQVLELERQVSELRGELDAIKKSWEIGL